VFNQIFKKDEIEIIPVKSLEYQKEWDGAGMIFYVKNGKGLLGHQYGHDDENGFLSLTFKRMPMIKFQSDNYFCPTCEKLISAGYGFNLNNDKTFMALRERFNAPFISLEQSFKNLEPLFGLLKTGYYALVDCEVYPTDGMGNFFWKMSNTPKANKASSYFCIGEHWSESKLKFILPSQSPKSFNPETAEFYRKHDSYRAIAYYLDGSLGTLIDGHHKAVAASLEHRMLKTLAIIPANSGWYKNVHYKVPKGGISFNEVKLYEDELVTSLSHALGLFKQNTLSEIDTKKQLAMINPEFDDAIWDEDIINSARFFPNAEQLVRMEHVIEINDQNLNKILNKEMILNKEEVLNLVYTLEYHCHSRFKELTFYFSKEYAYVAIWNPLFTILSKYMDDEIEQFFLDYIINSEHERKDIKQIIDNYFVRFDEQKLG
jgi:hypothetical protein